MAAQTGGNTGGPGSSALKRYAPFLAVVVVIAVVVGVLVVTGGGGNGGKGNVAVPTSTASGATGPVITYNQAKDAGTLAKYQWGASCDTTTGTVKLPDWQAPPCVPAFSGDNGGDLDPARGITKTTIRIGYYMAPPDPAGDALAKSVGAYDTPDAVDATVKGFAGVFGPKVELYGRTIQLVKLQGTGNSSDERAAQADAQRAKELKLFAVLGGPSQTKSFGQTLANEGILCIGSCVISRPMEFFKSNSPYIWPGILPDQTSALNVEFVKKQLAGKNAEFAGDAKYKNKPRTFVLLNYDTPDGGYKPVWNQWKQAFGEAGVPIKDQVSFSLNLPTIQADAQAVVQKLKAIDASTIIFTGDPLTPIYFTKEATKQGYFPEWVLSGTVFADTTVFARKYDPQQWAHAFGMSLIPTRIPRNQGAAYAAYTSCGTKPPPPADNSNAITYANERLLFTGLTLAGPKLSAQTFRDGLFNAPVPPRDPGQLRDVTTYGDHGIWPGGTDYGGQDTTGLVFWDPNAPGEDETATTGKGEWRYMENGKRYLPGEIPSQPMTFFDPANTVTYYDDSGKFAGTKPVPAALEPLPCK